MKTSPRPLLTLTTDFGTADFHLPRLKGSLLGAVPELVIVDVAHAIPPYDIVAAAFLLSKVWAAFPKGTCHLISVNDFYQPRGKFLLAVHEGQFFIAPDNGVLSLLFGHLPERRYLLPATKVGQGIREVYSGTVRRLFAGEAPETIGKRAESPTERLSLSPVIGADYIRGTVIFVDRFDNALTNIRQSVFEEVGGGRGVRLLLRRNDPIDGLSFRYHDVPEGEPLFRFSSDGHLEIAINLGRAATLMGIRVDDMVQLEFY